MAPLTFYGKKTCITCQKAKAFLEVQGVAYDEQPIETSPPPVEVLEQLVDAKDVKASLNARSTIFREQGLGKNVPGKAEAIRLMQQDPNLIKRPVIIHDGRLYQGFDEKTLTAFLANSRYAE